MEDDGGRWRGTGGIKRGMQVIGDKGRETEIKEERRRGMER